MLSLTAFEILASGDDGAAVWSSNGVTFERVAGVPVRSSAR